MSSNQFDHLLELIKPMIMKKNAVRDRIGYSETYAESCSYKLKLFISFSSSIACFKTTAYILVFFCMQNVNMIFICICNFNFNKKTITNQKNTW